jgi:hypothetical protein
MYDENLKKEEKTASKNCLKKRFTSMSGLEQTFD